ncbi:MAG: hypothetical protein PHD05_01550 [Sphaerochaetaceae bacterium]|nr:hypothetical protein [Sphaerochaetaceae bacterium]
MIKDYLPDLYSLDSDDFSDNYTILIANIKGQPTALIIPINSIVGRGPSGNISGLSATDVRTILNVENGADVTDAVNVASSIHAINLKSVLVNDDELAIIDSESSNSLKKLTWDILKTNITSNLGQSIHAINLKSVLVNDDELAIIDSESSNSLKKLTWDILKTNITSFYSSVVSTLSNKTFTNTRYVYFDNGNSGASKVIDYATGAHQKVTITQSCSLSFSNWPTSGVLGELILELTAGGAYTITWPTIHWIRSIDGSTTTNFSESGVTLQESGTDWCFFWSRDGGTTIYGKVVR